MNYNKFMLALLVCVVPLCRADNEGKSPSELPASGWLKLSEDAYQALYDITSIEGYRPMIDIAQEHGFTTKAAEQVWERCKLQAFAVGLTGTYLGYKLQRAALPVVGAFAALYLLRVGIDRYIKV